MKTTDHSNECSDKTAMSEKSLPVQQNKIPAPLKNKPSEPSDYVPGFADVDGSEDPAPLPVVNMPESPPAKDG
jgi:hypothetical protein